MLCGKPSLMTRLTFTTGLLHLAVWYDYGSQGNFNLLPSLPDNCMWLREAGGWNSFNWILALLSSWAQLRPPWWGRKKSTLSSLCLLTVKTSRGCMRILFGKKRNHGHDWKIVLWIVNSTFRLLSKSHCLLGAMLNHLMLLWPDSLVLKF